MVAPCVNVGTEEQSTEIGKAGTVPFGTGLFLVPLTRIALQINDAPYRSQKCDLAQVIPVDRTDRPSVPEAGPAMLNAGVKQKLSEPLAGSFAAPQWASGWSSGNRALIFCYFGIKAKVEIENDR